MSTPTYEQLLDFYHDFLEFEQEREKEDRDTILLLQALLEGYQGLVDNIVKLREVINGQAAKLQKTDLAKPGNPPFFDLYSDIQEDFSGFPAYQKYATFLEKET
jgi:hypothetical protein